MSAPNTPYGNTVLTPFGQSVDVGVSWADIKFTAEGGKREILKGLTGNALPRRTLAVMGSSGAGKTTFLNAISDRLGSDGKETVLSGDFFVNNVKYDRKYRTMVVYVTQDDVLNPMSTPVEALSFSLRVRRGTDPQETELQVEKLIEELGLTGARDTVVGIPGIMAGLSGGERKRTNIGIELITNPKILYLDEPTSGLDSVTSAKICQLMKKLALRGRTVIFTIHQPTAECISFFDDLMLMSQGKVVYHGPMDGAVEYFTSIGYACPDTFTPTDYFMTLMQNEDISPILIEKWDAFLKERDPTTYPYTAPPSVENRSFTEGYLNSYSTAATGTLAIEFMELQKRAWTGVVRNKMLIGASFIQNIVFGIIAALIFANLTNDTTGVGDRMGLLFMVIINGAFSAVFSMVNNFPPLKAVFIRDQQSGSYSPFLFFLTMSIAELPLQIFTGFLQCVIIYFSAQLVQEASNFFLFFAIYIATYQVGVGLGLAISTSFDSYTVASGVAPMVVIPFMLCAGLLASTSRLHPYWYWLEKPSFLRAGLILVLRNEFMDVPHISCNAAKYGASFCSRQPTTGAQVLEAYGFADEQAKPYVQWIILAGMFLVGRIICVAALYRVGRRKQ